MSTATSNPLVLGGALLAIAGIAGLTVPVFSTHKLTDVAKVGDVKLQADEPTTHVVPTALAAAVIAIGAALVVIGLTRKTA
jgi:hypothetical protein